MILTTAAILVGAGILLFAVGFVLSRPELAMFGAIIVIAAGAAGVSAGYQVQVGETQTTETVNTTVPLDDVGEATHVSSKDVSTEDGSPTGSDFSLDGRHMFVAGADTASVYSYSSDDYSLTLASARASYDVSSEDASPAGVALADGGSVMLVPGDANDTVFQYDLAEEYNVTTASPNGSFDVSGTAGSPRDAVIPGAGDRLYVLGSDARVHEYELNVSHDITTAEHARSFDVSAQERTPTGMDLSDDGTRMLLVGEGADTMFQYRLSTPYDVGSASYTGNYLDVSDDAARPSGVAYEDGGRRAFLSDRQNGDVHHYDVGEEQSREETSTQAVYEEVELPAGFPLGAVVLLLGTVMLMSSAGEASENGLGDGN